MEWLILLGGSAEGDSQHTTGVTMLAEIYACISPSDARVASVLLKTNIENRTQRYTG